MPKKKVCRFERRATPGGNGDKRCRLQCRMPKAEYPPVGNVRRKYELEMLFVSAEYLI
jgi:hypothetical protein